ncbi:MAG: L-seryl-tRNA(Sec) selenium transferase [Acidobacteria bacterium]|jgi:L-seryl-tRNA(Ser) seleniumtransferase|nr:L-seryl-tRNA(Sec) selenium transferase [Acidobacteriota bacterium]
MDPRRQLPSVDRLLAHPALAEAAAAWSRRALVGVLRDALDAARAAIGRGAAAPAEDELAAACAARLASLARPRPRRVVNATGVVIHTNLGRAPLGARARAWIELAAAGYSNLEYEVAKGERGHRADHVDELLGLLFPGFAAHVVNNNAAALLLALSALAKDRDVLISRGELIEIGGSFRIPEIMECSGAQLREVGTTNRTHLADFERALSGDTGLILRVWPSNYRIVGFTRQVPVAELAALGKGAGVPVLADQGCGRLFRDSPGPASEQSVEELLEDGADLVCFSGDKMLGGPQAGVLVGRRELVRRCAKHPLARALRPGKLTLAALAATALGAMAKDPAAELPALRMLSLTEAELRAAAEELAAALRAAVPGCAPEVVAGVSRVGGGAAPEEDLPTTLVRLDPPAGLSDDALLARLRAHEPPVVARVEEGRVLFDPRTLLPGERAIVAEAVAVAVAGAVRGA